MGIHLIQGDITELDIDCIVNAANERLQPGAGVCGAIHNAAGPELIKECQKIGHCGVGEARITKGYNLTAKHIIHTVGPIWHGGNELEPEMLASCYRNSLEVAQKHELRSIGFPSISTGVYGYPKKEAALIAIREVRSFLEQESLLKMVQFVCFSKADMDLYRNLL